MKLLAEISDQSLGLGEGGSLLGEQYTLGKSARAILFNERGEIAVQYVAKYNYHKLPGGGVESGELVEEALRRELQEEIGCSCEVVEPVGVVLEYRNQLKRLRISYCYVAKVVGEIGLPELTEKEIAMGQTIVWMLPEMALEKVRTDQPHAYAEHFILQRERVFLEAFLQSKKETSSSSFSFLEDEPELYTVDNLKNGRYPKIGTPFLKSLDNTRVVV